MLAMHRQDNYREMREYTRWNRTRIYNGARNTSESALSLESVSQLSETQLLSSKSQARFFRRICTQLRTCLASALTRTSTQRQALRSRHKGITTDRTVRKNASDKVENQKERI